MSGGSGANGGRGLIELRIETPRLSSALSLLPPIERVIVVETVVSISRSLVSAASKSVLEGE